jgi:enamine deaminase RidA (YjgF/YER057c/UK114 family)
MNIKEKILEMGLELPKATNPGGNYASVNVRGHIAYVAIQFPIRDGEYFYQGRLGLDLSLDEGYEAMQLTALNVLAQVEAKVGFDRVEGLNHFDAYYQSHRDWDEAPKVVNGASNLFVNALGSRGRHSRAIFGVEALPRNFSVGLTCSFTLLFGE